jgi:hypothetical protein
MIAPGEPVRFGWSEAEGRFVRTAQRVTTDPELLLLGPSTALVKKHWDRLPIGTYLAVVQYTRFPVLGIKPSNELSYVMRCKHSGQTMLIAGDSGFVDFKAKRGAKFYPSLLEALSQLNVVQVAHHGGLNADFYNALIMAHYRSQRDPSWLLLSHKTYDPKRPSDIFASFVGELRTTNRDIRILFTSRPRWKKIQEFTSLISPPVGPIARVGDVRLTYGEDGWQVRKHAIDVAPKSSLGAIPAAAGPLVRESDLPVEDDGFMA